MNTTEEEAAAHDEGEGEGEETHEETDTIEDEPSSGKACGKVAACRVAGRGDAVGAHRTSRCCDDDYLAMTSMFDGGANR